MSAGRPRVIFVSYKNRAAARQFQDLIGNAVRVSMVFDPDKIKTIPVDNLDNVIAIVVPTFRIGKGRRSLSHLKLCEDVKTREDAPAVIGVGRTQNWNGSCQEVEVCKTPTQAAQRVLEIIANQKAAEEAA